jgi:hypothetical protein
MTYNKPMAELKPILLSSATAEQILHHTDLINQGLAAC